MKDPKLYTTEIQKSVKDAIEEKYSKLEGKKQVLQIKNITFDPLPEPDDYERQKQILNKRGNEGVNVYADMSLHDKQTGQVIASSKKAKISFLPTMTNRYTFIVNGKEYIPSNQLRLRPAIYTKVDRTGVCSADFNLAKGKNMTLAYQPAKGGFNLTINKSHIPLYTVLADVYKVPEQELQKQFGELHNNQLQQISKKREFHLDHLYDLLHQGLSKQKPVDTTGKIEAIKSLLDKTIMDPDTNLKTLGVGYTKVEPANLIHAAKEVLAIYKGEKNPSYKDNLAFKSVHSSEDFLKEKLIKLAPATINKLKFKIDNAKTPSQIGFAPNIYKHFRSFFVESDLVNYPMQVNPYESLENSHKLTSLGEGGIGDTNALPPDARNLHPSHLGFLDPVRTPDNMRAGVDLRIATLTTKNQDKLVSMWKNAKTNKMERVSHTEAYDYVVAVENEPVHNGLLRAVHKGVLQEVPPSKVDYWIPTEGMYTVTTGSIPFLANTQGQRTAMGAKMTTQALSLTQREAPLVDTTANALVATAYHTKAKVAGTVSKILPTEIHVTAENGQTIKHFVPFEFPLNYHSYLHATPVVKLGDKVKERQVLAEHNFSKDNKMALGINASVAYMPYKGYNFEDAVAVTEQGAKKFTSNHIFQEVLEIPDDSIMVDAQKYKALYPGRFSPTQLSALSGATIKKGAEVHSGDPLVLALKKKRLDPELLRSGKSISRITNPITDAALVWERDYPGIVTDVIIEPSFIKVVVKAQAPLVLGDKLCGRYGNKGIVGKIIPDAEAPRDKNGNIPDVILNPAGLGSRMNNGQLYETALGKILKTTGADPVAYKNYNGGNTWEEINQALKKAKVTVNDDYIDPVTGKTIPKVFNGVQYIYKLMKQTETNFSARAGGEYDIDMRPVKGGEEGAKAVGNLDMYGFLGHGTTRHLLKEIATDKAEFNPEIMASIIQGLKPPPSKPTFVFNKAMTFLNGLGANIKRDKNTLQIMPQTDKDVLQRGPMEIQSAKMVNEKQDPVTGLNFRPEKGGLFDQGMTGGLAGSNWTHIKLAKPVVNSAAEKPIRALLGLSGSEYKDFVTGKKSDVVDGKVYTGVEFLHKKLSKINVKAELSDCLKQLDDPIAKLPLAKKDALIKNIKYLSALDRMKLDPHEAFINHVIPVIPPKFRPIYPDEKGKTVVTDANKLYADVININEQLNHPLTKALDPLSEHTTQLTQALHEAVQKLQGYDPTANDIQAAKKREPTGFLKVLVGTQPKMGFYQSKLMSRVQDLVGRATIAPDPTKSIDQVGLPKEMAWTLYKPFVSGSLVKSGYSLSRAAEEIEKKSAVATNALQTEMMKRPVILNRAPTLHKMSVLAFKPTVEEGKSLKICPSIVKGFGADFDGDSVYSSVFARFRLVDTQTNLCYSCSYDLDKSTENFSQKGQAIMALCNHITEKTGLVFLQKFPRIEETKIVKGNITYFDVPEGVEVLTLSNEKTYQWIKPESFSIHENLSMVRVETNNHRSVFASNDHSLVTLDSQLNLTKVPPTINTLVPIKTLPVTPEKLSSIPLLENVATGVKHQLKSSMELNYATGHLLGSIVGDGWVTAVSPTIFYLCFASITPELNSIWKDTIQNNIVSSGEVHFSLVNGDHEYQGYSCNSNKLTWAAAGAFGKQIKEMLGHKAQNKHLPEFFLEAPLAFRKGLLAGLIDTDGSITINTSGQRVDKSQANCIITTTSERLAFEIVALANTLGLVAGVTTGKTPADEICFSVYFSSDSVYKMKNLLVLYHPEKQAKLKQARKVDMSQLNYAPPLPKDKIKELREIVGCPRLYKKGTKNWITEDSKEIEQIKIRRSLYTVLYDTEVERRGKLPFLTMYTAQKLLSLDLPEFSSDPYWVRWKAWVTDENTHWELVTKVDPEPNLTTAYDLTIPPDYTMVTESSWVVFDTMSVHIPERDEAVEEAYTMLPSKNLFHVLDKSLWHTPQQETVMGLHAITKPKQSKPIKTFSTKQEAIDAYKAGHIAINDHVEIKSMS